MNIREEGHILNKLLLIFVLIPLFCSRIVAAADAPAAPVVIDLRPIDVKTSHACLELFTADDTEFPAGLMNACGEEMVVTSIQLADPLADKADWKEAQLGISPAPIAVLSADGGSCTAEVTAWGMFRHFIDPRYTRPCKEVIVPRNAAVHIAAPPFSFLRVAGHIGGKPLEVQGKTVDQDNAKASEKFRQRIESKGKPTPPGD